MDLLPQKNPTQLKGFVSKVEFIAKNLYRGRCWMGSFFFFATHVSTYFQWHAHQQGHQWHYYGSVFLLRGDSWATPTPVFCKMKLVLYSHSSVLT